ncbi:MAG: transglycosylase domain-containing protein [Bacteroidales bacterium]|nr:transglycosylase domain-containing protein [Bacteroidales bacterium]
MKKIGIGLLGTFIFLFIALLLLKNTLFQYIVESKIKHFNETHIGQIIIKDFQLSGISRIDFDSIYFISPFDTIGTIDTLSITIKPFKALFGDIAIKDIFWQNTTMTLCKYDSTDNFSTLFKRKNADTTQKTTTRPDYTERSSLIFKALFDILPEKGNISNINVLIKRKEKNNIQISIPFIQIHDYKINFPITISDKKNQQHFLLANLISPDDRTIYSKVVNKYHEKDFFPGFEKIQLKTHFDTAFFSIHQTTEGGNMLLTGQSELLHFFVNQPAVSFSDVQFDKLRLDYHILITENAFILDSTSQVHFNQLTFNPYIRFQVYPTKHIVLKINKPSFPAQELFSSLPEGLFPNTSGIKAKGNLSYKLYFEVDFSLLDSLKLESDLRPEKLSIYSYGNVNLAKLDSDFVHTVYEKEQPVDQILVSYSNPNFVPLQQISPYLRNALLCTEDGAFYWHRGFIQEAFKNALIQNLKRKRFARGGSTITMQLVKNLYLNRHKTISRKLEEMLIVWIIENMRLCSKDRMFEIYLNIIEFGPSIYGVSKGSQFYFNKKPSELSLPEAIFMASIVPKPKHFASSFDSTGTLKPAVQDFLKFVANRMLGKQMISQSEFDAFQPQVELKGEAKKFLKSDTLSLDELLPPINFY